MISTLSSVQSKSARRWAIEESSVEPFEEASVEPIVDPADMERLPNHRLPLRKRASRAVTRFLIAFCIGVVATLAWQSYGDAAREVIANSSPQLGWLAPQAAPDAPFPELQQLRETSTGLAAVRQSVDQLSAKFVAGQEQMTRDITKLHAAEQEILENILKLHATEQDILANILDKISAPAPRPAAAPVRKTLTLTPAPLTPPPATQAPPVR
jgi:hypothetical protein